MAFSLTSQSVYENMLRLGVLVKNGLEKAFIRELSTKSFCSGWLGIL